MPQQAPQLFNVVNEMASPPASRCPRSTSSTTHRPTPSRPAAIRSTRRGDHDRPAPEAEPRGAAGRPRPRDVARPQLRHPVHADRRRHGRQHRPAGPASSCATRSGSAAAGVATTTTTAAAGWQIDLLVVGRRDGHPGADLHGLVQMAVSRQREYLADASSVELTRNPHGLESALAKLASDNEPLHSANGATQHLYIVNPLKKLGGGSLSSRPIRRSSIGSTGCASSPARRRWTRRSAAPAGAGPGVGRGAARLSPAARPPLAAGHPVALQRSVPRGTFPRADGQPVRQFGPR
jgi:hypothetical protein